jgi:hypothetical protein
MQFMSHICAHCSNHTVQKMYTRIVEKLLSLEDNSHFEHVVAISKVYLDRVVELKQPEDVVIDTVCFVLFTFC